MTTRACPDASGPGDRHRRWLAWLLPVMLLLANGNAIADAAPAEPKLLINQDFADPDVLRTDDGYAAFSTVSKSGRIPVATAAKPDGPWSVRGDALARPPSWAKAGTGLWAPDVSKRSDGKYLMYFSATVAANGRMCIGAAIATAPTGPYEPEGDAPLVCVADESGDIDPQAFVDSSGTRFLLYKGDGAPVHAPAAIWEQPTDVSGLTISGPRKEILRADLHAEQSVVEAPSMVRQESGYLLFYSADMFTSSGYHTTYATADDVAGPFVKADDPFLSTGNLAHKVDGPGGADVVDDHIFFHGWLNPEHTARGLFTMPIVFENGIPRLG